VHVHALPDGIFCQGLPKHLFLAWLPGNAPSVLRDAVLMKPGSTPADLFSVLHRPPWQLVDANSQFVRAEARVLQV